MSLAQWRVPITNVGGDLLKLADRVKRDSFGPLPPYIHSALRMVMRRLRRGFPGVHVVVGQRTADDLFRRGLNYARDGQFRHALEFLIRALADSKYDSQIWHQVGIVCLHFDETELAVDILIFAVWINPRNIPVKEDLALIQQGEEDDDESSDEEDDEFHGR